MTAKGTLITFKGRESSVNSTFNIQWRDGLMLKFVSMVEMLMNANVYSLTIDVMVDDLGNVRNQTNFLIVILLFRCGL